MVVGQQNQHLRLVEQRSYAPDMLLRRSFVRMDAAHMAVGLERDSDLALARDDARVVSGVACKVDPRSGRVRAREDVDVAGEVARGVDDVHAAVAEVVVGAWERPDGLREFCVEEPGALERDGGLEAGRVGIGGIGVCDKILRFAA